MYSYSITLQNRDLLDPALLRAGRFEVYYYYLVVLPFEVTFINKYWLGASRGVGT